MAAPGESTEHERKADMRALKKKKEISKKAELLREIHKLDVQIQAMEREKLTHIYSKRSDFHREYVALKEEEEKMKEDRITERIRLQQQLEKLSLMVKKLYRELRDVKPTQEFVERLKVIMDEIEGAINSFKEQQKKKYEDLMKVEKSVTQELQQLEKKFDSWSQIQSKTPAFSQPARTNNMKEESHNLPPEVAAFDKFVSQSGGHRGGWDEHDHQTFLRYRNMYKGRIVFLDHVKPMLPIRQEAEIREHESWYQEYVFLNENKKHAIKKWRENKEDQKEDAMSQASKLDLEPDDDEVKRKKAMEQLAAKERAGRFREINAWKVQKELEKAMLEERKLKTELESVKKKESERKRQLEVKKYVDEFRHQRQQEEEMLQMMEEERNKEEQDRRKQITARDLGRFRDRDLQKLRNKLEQEKEKETAELEKEKKLQALKNQVRCEAVRDPNRLLQPTAGWKERMKMQGSESGGQVINMPHRAIPSWRQGLK